MRNVDVLSYSESRPKLFEQEVVSLREIFGDLIVDMHHIGSTSVPGLKAKPIIDIMLIVSTIEKIDLYNKEMIKIGYEPKGENGIVDRRYFQKGAFLLEGFSET